MLKINSKQLVSVFIGAILSLYTIFNPPSIKGLYQVDIVVTRELYGLLAIYAIITVALLIYFKDKK